MLSVSGRQLFMIDSFRDTNRPLLSILADPDSIFMRGLAKFKNRTLYSNIVNDRTATFYTTCISATDPFTDLDNVDISYLPGFDPIILDPNRPATLRKPDTSLVSLQYSDRVRAVLNRAPTFLFLALFVPLGLTLFTVNAGIQSIMSVRRIRLHEAGKAGIDAAMYRMPLMVEDIQHAAEDVYGNINAAQSQEYIVSPDESEGSASSSEVNTPRPSSPLLRDANGKAESKSASSPLSSPSSPDSPAPLDTLIQTPKHQTGVTRPPPPHTRRRSSTFHLHKQQTNGFPTLALAEVQFAMIRHLDELGWEKYPVWIHNDGHSHAAIIARKASQRARNGGTGGEAAIVMSHWVTRFEI
jgi:hypothetical protein